MQRGSAARGVCGSRGLVVAGAKRIGDAGRVSQSGSLLKCCANFICKLWQKRGLYANLHGKSRQGERGGAGAGQGGLPGSGSGLLHPHALRLAT